MKSCGVDLKLNTIQAIRMVSAITESDFLVHLNEEDCQIFDYLHKFFDIDVRAGVSGVPILNEISINHKEPSCTIGSITKPLIFPMAVFDLCKSKWKSERKFTFYFSGLITDKRARVLRNWILSHFRHKKFRNDLDFFFIKIMTRYVQSRTNLLKKGVSGRYKVSIGKGEQLCLVSSTIGRNFPEKAWDDNYFNQMANAKFVLCPNGDFIWTYRFLEAVICGAIPIVEDEAEMYRGFHYYKMSDDIGKYVYIWKHVLENFDLALHRFTVTSEKLNEEIINCL